MDKRYKVLVVEDSPTQAEELGSILEQRNCVVTLAYNGKDALNLLQENPLDLIISDIVMPRMSGFNLCREIRSDFNLMNIPIILLTSLIDPVDVLQILECGATNFLIKPFDDVLLFSCIEQTFGNSEIDCGEVPKQRKKVIFRGVEHKISTEPQYVIEFLISAYEDMSHKKLGLEKANDRLMQVLEERELQELELITAKEAAESVSLAKSEFLAGMSHELRTPLNAVIGFSEMLKKKYFGELNEKQEQYVQDIKESGEHLLSLINDTLDLSKIEAGRMDLSLKEVQVQKLLKNSLVMIKTLSIQKNIDLKLKIADEIETLKFTVDERMLKQVLYNLLSNALKFTPNGEEIILQAGLKKQEVIITIIDSGIGISHDDQRKIFDDFYQVEGSMLDKIPGSGLGLSLVRSMVEMHGGRIKVESEGLGKGSSFSFSIPLHFFPEESFELKKEKGFPVLQKNDDQFVRNRIDIIISFAQRYKKIFSIGFFHIEGKSFDQSIDVALNILVKAKRIYDIVEADIDGFIYLLMPETDNTGARIACNRVIDLIKTQTGEKDAGFNLVEYPVDGDTAFTLIEKVRRY
ncbi:MAG: hybrid sensor histidine kinase/response regulator [Spirochaetaceae bacterium]